MRADIGGLLDLELGCVRDQSAAGLGRPDRVRHRRVQPGVRSTYLLPTIRLHMTAPFTMHTGTEASWSRWRADRHGDGAGIEDSLRRDRRRWGCCRAASVPQRLGDASGGGRLATDRRGSSNGAGRLIVMLASPAAVPEGSSCPQLISSGSVAASASECRSTHTSEKTPPSSTARSARATPPSPPGSFTTGDWPRGITMHLRPQPPATAHTGPR